MDQRAFDYQFAIGWMEFAQRRQLMLDDLELKGQDLRRAMTRHLKWWTEFVDALTWAIEREQQLHHQEPEWYFMPLEQVAYYDHWQRQLRSAGAIKQFIFGRIGEIYGKI